MFTQFQPQNLSVQAPQAVYLMQVPTHFTVVEAQSFQREYDELLHAPFPPAKIIFDCAKTTFIDGCGIGVLTSCLNLAEAEGVKVSFWSVSAPILEALSISGLRPRCEIENQTLAIASSWLQGPSRLAPLSHPSVRSRGKRYVDLAGAVVGLTITAVLLVPIAIAIQLENPGPILFSQTRCGHMGRRFRIWKFRSMVTNAEALKSQVANESTGAFFKNANDPRITRVGRFLRKTSLDELPQFWNVLRGDMSLVGTRPPLPSEVEQYEPKSWQRLDVKPGLTGEWQVSGRSKISDFDEVVNLDLRYQRRWSVRYDLKLMVKTFAVLFNKGSAV